MTVIVTNQQELDAAVAAGELDIQIRSSAAAAILVSDYTTVTACDSATVTAYGSATVRAYGWATVTACDSATVRAYGSATVTAYDWATVRAYGSATVTAYGSATVTAYGSATVTASSHVAVHAHSTQADIAGGVVIDHASVDMDDAPTWAAYVGAEVSDGFVTLYKATEPDLSAGRDYDKVTFYHPGRLVVADDWTTTPDCGGGLHLSPAPTVARRFRGTAEESRFLKVRAPLASVVPLGTDKCKVPECRVICEVDIDGNEIASEASGS